MKENLKYDPETGKFTYYRSVGCRRIGQEAGWITANGYRYIKASGVAYPAHVLAWFYMTGDWPDNDIDHKDLDRDNNAWPNLRLATRPQNASNAKLRADNKLGIKGVRKLKDTGKYQVRINGKSYGCYSDLELAELVCREVRDSVHGQFANHG